MNMNIRKTLTIVLTDGPYISEYAEIAYKIARTALKKYKVNIFLYLDAVNIPKIGQKTTLFRNEGDLFQELADDGVIVRGCLRCATARGYLPDENGTCPDYHTGIKITSIHELAEMLKQSDEVISLSG